MEVINIENEDVRPYKKFVETFTFGDGREEYEAMTDTGWVTVKSVGKTVDYEVWELHLSDREEPFRCADTHTVYKFDKESNTCHETFVCDLREGDFILTDDGLAWVVSLNATGRPESMYDLQLVDDNRRFYTSGILSHNSIWLSNIAAKSVTQGNNTAVVTMEMSESLYIKRLGSNLLNIDIGEYKKLANDQNYIKKQLSNLGFDSLQVPGQLVVKEFPTSAASVLDIESYLKRVEERRKIKFKVVVIDYINILKNWRNPNSENTYMKIKQIAEDARAMAQRNGWAIVTATQTKQSAFDMADLNMGHASESSGLVATVDLMFGIIQDPLMYSNKKYKLKTLANRNEGFKNSKQSFDIAYNYMRLTQDSSSIEEGELY